MSQVHEVIGYPLLVTTNEQAISIEFDTVLSQLEGADSGDFLIAAQRLDVLLAQATELQSQDPVPRTFIADSLSSAYQGIRDQPTSFQRLRRWVAGIVGTIANAIAEFLSGGAILGQMVRWLALAGVFAAVIFFALKVTRRIRLVSETSAGIDSAIQRQVDWRSEGEKALAQGDLREAVRSLFRAIIQSLASRGVIDDDPSVTAGECRRAVRDFPLLSSAVERAAGIFELVTYGEAEPTSEQVEIMQHSELSVRSAA